LTSNIDRAYRELLSKTKEAVVLSTAQGIIHWDMEIYMPPKAVEQRSQQLALLSRIHHKLGTDPKIGKLLNTIQTSPHILTLGQVEKRNLYLINKSYQEQTALPEKLVGDLAMQEAKTVNIWKKAKAKKNFNLFKDDFQKLLDLSKQAAEILMKSTTIWVEAVNRKGSRFTNQTFNRSSQSTCLIGKSTQNYPTHNGDTWLRYCFLGCWWKSR
jgi:Zn-dependent M32 family carboxypeptidase